MKITDEPAYTFFKSFFNAGSISINIFTYVRYNQVFEAYLKKGLSRNKSYEYAADECGCSKLTMMNAVKFINQELPGIETPIPKTE